MPTITITEFAYETIVRALEQGSGPGEASGVAVWWRTHQVVVLVLYFLAGALAWQIKEWQHGPSNALFVFVGVAATTAGVFRGHLLFTEQMNRTSLAAERGRADPVTYVVDLAIALALGVDGLMLAGTRPLYAMLTIALGVGIALARAVLERATTRAAFAGEA